MAQLIYTSLASLDGYVEDAAGDFRWAAPDDEVLAHISERERPIGTYLYGRHMYETMRYWETEPGDDAPLLDREWARLWRGAAKIVYSRTLAEVTTAHTTLEHEFDPLAVQQMVDASTVDVTIGGAELAGQALMAGIVHEVQLYAVPIVVGGGKPWLPTGVRIGLELLEAQRFRSGVVWVRYRVASTRKRRL